MKSTNFEFLREKRPELANLGYFAEQYANTDPASALQKLRLMSERITKIVYDSYRLHQLPRASFYDLLEDAEFRSILPNSTWDKIQMLRKRGNSAVHGDEIIPNIARLLIKEAYDVAGWFHMDIDGGSRSSIPAFVPIGKIELAKRQKTEKASQALHDKLRRAENETEALLQQLEAIRLEREAQKIASTEEKEVFKTQAAQVARELDFNETETRKNRIDVELGRVGWDVSDKDQVGLEVEVDGQPTPTGKGFADYVLWGDDGKPLAVIEAKKMAKDVNAGKTQARLYADALERKFGQRPLIFYSNGRETWLWDDVPTLILEHGASPRKVYGFYSKDSLEYHIFQRANKSQLGLIKPKAEIADRLYQTEAIRAVADRFADGQRKALIVQATGTGKTRVAISITELLSRAKWIKRVLFLCDRRELLKQADNAFKNFLPTETRTFVNAKTAQDRKKRIYLATYPAMIKQFENFDVGFFDLIIADESHRSIYNKYRDLFRYFDAYQLGLTATPRGIISHDTYRLFDCADGNPTAHYGLKEAIEHVPPHLVSFKVVKHTTRFLRDGIKWNTMTAKQKQQFEAQVESAEETNFESTDIGKNVFTKDTDRRIIRNLMEDGIRDASGSLPGKTIIFARNHNHAVHLVETFDELYPKYGGKFCHVIDNHEARASQLIDDFKDPKNELRIAVSVDMLDTGIDVPEIVNLVFAKPVKSYVKFWQMIGRGTRLSENLYGIGEDKKEFLIFDHFGNFEYFDENPTESEKPATKPFMQRLFEARVELADTANTKMDADAFSIAIDLIRKDLNALVDSKTIEVRDNWRDIETLRDGDTLQQFDAMTHKMLFDRMAPLARWIDIRKSEDARRFDFLMTKLQIEHLKESSLFDDLRGDLQSEMDALKKNLNQVKAKSETIRNISSADFWNDISIEKLEFIRTDLRSIMKYKMRTRPPKFEARYIDVMDGDEVSDDHVPKYNGQELIAYRQRVESALEQISDNPILAKIKAGHALTESEIEDLSKVILGIDPLIRLKHLPTQLNLKGDLHRAIRSIVGLETEAVEEVFKDFVKNHSELSAVQIRFLRTLKNIISQYGGLEIDRLWEDPFDRIAVDGIDGLFSNSEVDDIVSIVEKFELAEVKG